MQDLAHNFLELKDKTLKLNVGVLSEGSCLLILQYYSHCRFCNTEWNKMMIMYSNAERNKKELFVDYFILCMILGSDSSVPEDSSFLGCHIM